MYFRHNGEEFLLSFFYDHLPMCKPVSKDAWEFYSRITVKDTNDWIRGRGNPNNPEDCAWIRTTCTIEKVAGEMLQLIGFGYSYKTPEDQFTPALGRRVSLERALRTHVSPDMAKYLDNKSFRREVWRNYFARHKDGKGINVGGVIQENTTQRV